MTSLNVRSPWSVGLLPGGTVNALDGGLRSAFAVLLETGDGVGAAREAVAAFLATPEGARAARSGATYLLNAIDRTLRTGASARAYRQLLLKAADPRTHQRVLESLAKLGAEGQVLGRAANRILKAFGKSGLAGAVTQALKLSPATLKLLGKAATAVPVAGLLLSVVLSAKALVDPNAGGARKAAAVVSLASGIVSTVAPGSGVATAVVDLGVSLLADGYEARKRGAS